MNDQVRNPYNCKPLPVSLTSERNASDILREIVTQRCYGDLSASWTSLLSLGSRDIMWHTLDSVSQVLRRLEDSVKDYESGEVEAHAPHHTVAYLLAAPGEREELGGILKTVQLGEGKQRAKDCMRGERQGDLVSQSSSAMSSGQVEREGEAEEGKRCSNGNRQHGCLSRHKFTYREIMLMSQSSNR
jgi:hypothetical protein